MTKLRLTVVCDVWGTVVPEDCVVPFSVLKMVAACYTHTCCDIPDVCELQWFMRLRLRFERLQYLVMLQVDRKFSRNMLSPSSGSRCLLSLPYRGSWYKVFKYAGWLSSLWVLLVCDTVRRVLDSGGGGSMLWHSFKPRRSQVGPL
jgi:hypothetical protein